MKHLVLFSFLFVCQSIFSQITNPNYNDSLAKMYGADEYGMKSYYFVLLRTGTNTSTDEEFINKCFSDHMSNINELVRNGKLIIAGPFGKNEDELRGIFILNASTIEEVNMLLEKDTAIQEDLITAYIYPWYGSAAIPAYLEYSDKVWKKNP